MKNSAIILQFHNIILCNNYQRHDLRHNKRVMSVLAVYNTNIYQCNNNIDTTREVSLMCDTNNSLVFRLLVVVLDVFPQPLQ